MNSHSPKAAPFIISSYQRDVSHRPLLIAQPPWRFFPLAHQADSRTGGGCDQPFQLPGRKCEVKGLFLVIHSQNLIERASFCGIAANSLAQEHFRFKGQPCRGLGRTKLSFCSTASKGTGFPKKPPEKICKIIS